MGGTEATRVSGGQEPIAFDDAVRVEAQHWRELATGREADLVALTRRPVVRLALGVDRRLAPVGRRLTALRDKLRRRLDRTLRDLAALLTRPARHRRRLSLARTVGRLGPVPASPTVSVITVAPSVADEGHAAAGEATEGVGGTGRSRTAALAAAASAATGDVLCFMPESVDSPAPGWLERLTASLGGDVVAATPSLLHPDRQGAAATEHDLLVRSEGYGIDLDRTGAPVMVARAAGRAADVAREPVDVAAAPLQCLAVDRAAYLAAGGLVPSEVDDLAAVDLCMRLHHRGGRIRHVPAALAFDGRPVASRRALRHPIDLASPAWRSLVERQGPALVRAARSPRDAAIPRWVITTAAPSTRIAPRWGDWHLAEALAGALCRLGQEVRVQALDQADSLAARSCDVHLVVHGLGSVQRTPGQRHIIWVISHPETVDIAECDAADLVLVASERYATHLRSLTATPVEVLLQATDADRFRPQAHRPKHDHPVTIVGKTRGVLRPVVADALAAGIRPAIYGSGWRTLVDPDLVVADHVDNAELPEVYGGAGVVLNDHWDTMRAWGFVSNRLFDVLACGTPVISDDVVEIHELFGDAVPTYGTSAELGALVARTLDDPTAARARAAGGRAIVLTHHTFDHRAAELLELLGRHGLRCDQKKDGRRS